MWPALPSAQEVQEFQTSAEGSRTCCEPRKRRGLLPVDRSPSSGLGPRELFPRLLAAHQPPPLQGRPSPGRRLKRRHGSRQPLASYFCQPNDPEMKQHILRNNQGSNKTATARRCPHEISPSQSSTLPDCMQSPRETCMHPAD